MKHFPDYRTLAQEPPERIQRVLSGMAKTVTDMLDKVFSLANLDDKEILESIERDFSTRSLRIKTAEGIELAKGLDEQGRPWYEYKDNNLELYKYWKTAEHPDKTQDSNWGGWDLGSQIQTISLRDPSVKPKASYFQHLTLELGQRNGATHSKLIDTRANDVWSKPSLDQVSPASEEILRTLNLRTNDFKPISAAA